ncbi:MAG: HAD-IA family hydrolase [Gemmataceae bacterium]|nr:HAD-IA family hydrolase [Gemmataceae bacterium]
MVPDHVRGIIFDCDGTLADTMPAHFQAWAAATADHGLEFPEERFYSLGGMPSRRIVALLADEQGVTVDIDLVAAEKERLFMKWLPEVQRITAVCDVALAHHGSKPLAVASGGYRRIVTATLSQLDLLHLFETIVTAEDTPRHKPEPDVFLEAARRLGVDPAECLVFEDTDIGLEAATRAGMIGFDVRKVHTPRRVIVSG